VTVSVFKSLVPACILSLLVSSASIGAVPPGFLEGHLKVISPKEVELADGTSPVIEAQNYANFPLIILSQDGKNEVARINADVNGNYHTALPPGNYVLDVPRRAPGHIRAKPQRFTVVSNQTVRVDMDIDTGVR